MDAGVGGAAEATAWVVARGRLSRIGGEFEVASRVPPAGLVVNDGAGAGAGLGVGSGANVGALRGWNVAEVGSGCAGPTTAAADIAACAADNCRRASAD